MTKKMNAETLSALRGSIAKWEAIVAGTGFDKGQDNCPLCHMFVWRKTPDGNQVCHGCPVSAKTGMDGCRGTPYITFAVCNGELAEAEKEVAFLKSLLPPGEAP